MSRRSVGNTSKQPHFHSSSTRNKLAASQHRRTLTITNNLGRLAADLDLAWHAHDTDPRLKKRILRALIEDIVVDIDDDRHEVACVIHWKGGLHSGARVPRRRRGQDGSQTSADVVDGVSQLARICDDKLVAAYLNRNGILTARGNRWNHTAESSVRTYRGIPVHCPQTQQADGGMNLTSAASYYT